MASRAPLDLRVNTLKAKREKVLASLKHLGAQETPWSPIGLRIELGADARNPGIHAEEDFIKGGIEVQDEGSQLAALFSAAKPGEQVIDLCAGAGGKTLALAAMMQGKGRLIATDHDKASACADLRAAVPRRRPQRRQSARRKATPIHWPTSAPQPISC
jgi:16S rRNA (cytosine967-C5)-methyltransferase